ncbi:MAG: nuclear transport factor 2 family protein [Gemmataceae bacterium]|nr:nuclear transport factor 2 family protein [Gemmataceae bacterium]
MDRKQTVMDFFRLARSGDSAAAAGLCTPGAKHHNAYFPAGMGVLLAAIAQAEKSNPATEHDVKRIIADGDHVAVHSHVRHKPGDAGYAVVHIFRFEGDKIAELWDLGQAVPTDGVNADGMF